MFGAHETVLLTDGEEHPVATCAGKAGVGFDTGAWRFTRTALGRAGSTNRGIRTQICTEGGNRLALGGGGVRIATRGGPRPVAWVRPERLDVGARVLVYLDGGVVADRVVCVVRLLADGPYHRVTSSRGTLFVEGILCRVSR